MSDFLLLSYFLTSKYANVGFPTILLSYYSFNN